MTIRNQVVEPSTPSDTTGSQQATPTPPPGTASGSSTRSLSLAEGPY